MDGNGRWAEQRGLPRLQGHHAGIEPVRSCVRHAAGAGVEVLTLFAFSSENWRRPAAEIEGLMALFADALRAELAELHANGVRLQFIGDRARLSPVLERATAVAAAQTADNSGLTLVIAFGYGGRWDLVQATRRLAAEVVAGELRPEDIDETALASRLQTAELPEVDLLIRTGGEQRISNFLLWDSAYSELFFTELAWPDFGPAAFDAALAFYAGRQRRFGRTREQIEAVSC
jgi:undecaprenyl diphosphate synthase